MSGKTDVLIIGAGAAGLFCAALAGQRGRRVVVLDHANKPGKKILMSGGGRCNFTNYYIEPERYLSHNPHFCKSALSRYTQWDFIELVTKHGIPFHEKKDGRLFCDNKASDILNMLLTECEQGGVDIRMNTQIEAVSHNGAEFSVTTQTGKWNAESLVIATGGPSIPTLGASGFGYDIARQFEHEVYAPRAGLVPFTITDDNKALCSALSGTALPVTVGCNGKFFSDDMLFTHRGLSGPAMLQISSYWREGDYLDIDLLPSVDVAQHLQAQRSERPKVHIQTWLAEMTTQKFAEQWLAALKIENRALAEFGGEKAERLIHSLQHWQVRPAGTEGYRTAEVALGGVNTDELSSRTMASKRVPGLYFIGEVVDVTGHLGGFNFQWAWASAAAAAEAI